MGLGISEVENEETRASGDEQDSHPSMAENPLVSQPGLLPDVMSLIANQPMSYSKGLRKPSEGLPFES
jgi:hypothetical protein